MFLGKPFFAEQQREMTIFSVLQTTWTTADNFWFLYLELNAFFAYSTGASSKTEGYTEYI